MGRRAVWLVVLLCACDPLPREAPPEAHAEQAARWLKAGGVRAMRGRYYFRYEDNSAARNTLVTLLNDDALRLAVKLDALNLLRDRGESDAGVNAVVTDPSPDAALLDQALRLAEEHGTPMVLPALQARLESGAPEGRERVLALVESLRPKAVGYFLAGADQGAMSGDDWVLAIEQASAYATETDVPAFVALYQKAGGSVRRAILAVLVRFQTPEVEALIRRGLVSADSSERAAALLALTPRVKESDRERLLEMARADESLSVRFYAEITLKRLDGVEPPVKKALRMQGL